MQSIAYGTEFENTISSNCPNEISILCHEVKVDTFVCLRVRRLDSRHSKKPIKFKLLKGTK